MGPGKVAVDVELMHAIAHHGSRPHLFGNGLGDNVFKRVADLGCEAVVVVVVGSVVVGIVLVAGC